LEKIMDKSEVINLITKTTKTLTGIPIPEVEFNRLFDERINDAFQYLNDILLETKKSGKIPVLIFDELQMIKEITANGQKYLLKELFQFLVSLTKERHLAHCLCLTSDSLFAEYVYNKGELRGRAKYLLVDDFDKETSFKYMDFLAKENNIKFSNEQKEQIYSTVGGKPKDIKYAVEESMFKDLNEILEMMLNDEYRNLNDFLMDLDYINLKVPIRNGIVDVKKEDIINTLKLFKDNYEISVDDIPKAAYICLVKEGILFLNPRKGTLKPQSFLVWNGIKKLI